MNTSPVDQKKLIDAQSAQLRELAESLESQLQDLPLTLAEPMFSDTVTRKHPVDAYMAVDDLKRRSHDLAMLARCVAAGAVPLYHYDEASYVYYDRIEDDPLWGIDYDSDSETDPYWDEHLEHTYEALAHEADLGWWIRTSKRSAEALTSLYKRRAWLADCRAKGLDLDSREATIALHGTPEEREARRLAKREAQRIQTENFLRLALGKAREVDNIHINALVADERAHGLRSLNQSTAAQRSDTEFLLRRALREAWSIDGIDIDALVAEE